MESITDLQQHIRKRLTEIEDLDERKDAREILLEGLVPIFERMEKRYLDLENQIKREIEIPNEKYAVSMTVITQKDYDPINGTLYPVVPALLQEDKEQEKQEAMPCIIYFAGSYQKKAEFEKAADFQGVDDSGKSYTVRVRKAKCYQQAFAKPLIPDMDSYLFQPFIHGNRKPVKCAFYCRFKAQAVLFADNLRPAVMLNNFLLPLQKRFCLSSV